MARSGPRESYPKDRSANAPRERPRQRCGERVTQQDQSVMAVWAGVSMARWCILLAVQEAWMQKASEAQKESNFGGRWELRIEPGSFGGGGGGEGS